MILNPCTTATGAKIEYNNQKPEEFIILAEIHHIFITHWFRLDINIRLRTHIWRDQSSFFLY